MVNRLIYMSAINPCNPCLKNSSLLALFLNLLKVSLFAYQPDDIAFFEYSGRQNTGQVLPALFQSYHHTVVFIPYSAFYQCLSQEFAAAADDELAKFHFALFYFSLLRQQVALQGGVEFLQLVVQYYLAVHKGDTLYSYVLLGNIVNQYAPNILPSAVKETHDMEVQAKLAQQEIPVLRTRLAELRKQKASESSDIYYGLTDNTKRNALDAEIAEVEEELRKQAKKVEIYAQAKNTTYNFMSRRGAGRANAAMPYSNTSIYNPGLIHYCCAPADAYISKINASDKTLVFKSEEVMVIQHTDYADCHLGVIAYVPNDMVKYMESPDDADIIINKDLELKAKLQMVGLRVEEIPKHLQSNFSHDANAVVAVFTLNPNQRVPAWVMSNRLPVRIRVNKIGAMLDPKPLPMYTVPVGKNENVKRSNRFSIDTNNHQEQKK